LFGKARSVAVYGCVLFGAKIAFVIYYLARDIKHSPQNFAAHRDPYRVSCINHFHPTAKAFRCIHGNTANLPVSNMLKHFHYNRPALLITAPGFTVYFYLQGI
jgi:hypothetical protein